MRNLVIVIVAVLALSLLGNAGEKPKPLSSAELAEITARGRFLASYDAAAWRATDAVQALKPAEGEVRRYIERKTEAGWTGMFGHLNEQRTAFLIVYEVTQDSNGENPKVQKCDPPKPDTGFFLHAASGVNTALGEFTSKPIPNRPYNVAVLPTNTDTMYIYVFPAQTDSNVYPLGGDARYTISADGSRIVEKRELHKSILEAKTGSKDINVQAGFHTHVITNTPEDTDVFHVLVRRPAVPEYVGAGKNANYIYKIDTDGGISVVKK